MSIQFSDTTNYKGLVQLFERECGYDRGYISDNTTRLKQYTADANITFDRFLSLAFSADGRWQFDDSNHGDYPEIEADLVSGQRDYTFLTDEQGNVILDIYRVLVKDSSGVYVDVEPVDKQTEPERTTEFVDGKTYSGTPTRYDKTANGILFDITPNYNWRYANEGERGVKVLINREASYFSYDDTTKKPGVPGLFHEYFAVHPAMKEALRKERKTAQSLVSRVTQLEDDIIKHFSRRAKDERQIITNKKIMYI